MNILLEVIGIIIYSLSCYFIVNLFIMKAGIYEPYFNEILLTLNPVFIIFNKNFIKINNYDKKVRNTILLSQILVVVLNVIAFYIKGFTVEYVLITLIFIIFSYIHYNCIFIHFFVYFILDFV